MMTFLRRTIPILTLAVLVVLTLACGGDGEEELPFGLQSEVVTNADHVSDMVFAPDGRMFFAEQYTGTIRVISGDGQLQDEPFVQVTVAEWLTLDWGLTGLALDPDFQDNHYVYAFYTAVPGAAGGATDDTGGLVSAVPPGEDPAGSLVVRPGPCCPRAAPRPHPAPPRGARPPHRHPKKRSRRASRSSSASRPRTGSARTRR
jgi:hypothetical protein